MVRARECLDEIVALYENGTDQKRNELLERVTDLYFLTLEQQTQEEREIFGDVMERMAYDTDAHARSLLAERLSKAEVAPAKLMRRLANDEIMVARPVLQYSAALREGDLISILKECEPEHVLAIAHRPELTKPVTDLMIEHGAPRMLAALISNIGAQISSESLNRLSDFPEIQDKLQEVISVRRDLAPSTIDRIKKLGDAEFWQRIAQAALMTDVEIESEKQAMPEEKKAAKPEEETKPEVNKNAQGPGRKREAQLHPRTLEPKLVDAARSGKVVETVQYFSKISGLEERMIEHCLFEAHLPAMMVLCKAHHMATTTFTSLLQLRETVTGTPANDPVGLLRRYESMTPETAQRIIRFSDRRKTANKNGDEKEAEDGNKENNKENDVDGAGKNGSQEPSAA